MEGPRYGGFASASINFGHGLNPLRETLQLFAEAFGLGGVVVLDGVLQKSIQPLDLLNLSAIARRAAADRIVS